MRIERILFTGGKTHLQPKGVSESGNSTTATLQCMHRKFLREGKIDREERGSASKYARYCYCTQRDTGELREERWGHFLRSDLEYE